MQDKKSLSAEEVSLDDYKGCLKLSRDELKRWCHLKAASLKHLSTSESEFLKFYIDRCPASFRSRLETYYKLKESGSTTEESDEFNPYNQCVISWFGHDILDMDLMTNNELENWCQAFSRLVDTNGYHIFRLGSPIDVIVGKKYGTFSRKEFWAFQKMWDNFNDKLEFRMSGFLSLANLSEERTDVNGPVDWVAWEAYRHGRCILGTSVGRPIDNTKNAGWNRRALEILQRSQP